MPGPGSLPCLPAFVPTTGQQAELDAAHRARFGRPATQECYRMVPLCCGMEEWLGLLADVDRMAHILVNLYLADPGCAMFSPPAGNFPEDRA